MKRTILVTASVATISALGIVGPTMVAHAAATDSTNNATATKTKPERVRRIHLQARLNQAVRDGVITDAQKKAFVSELKALAAQRKTDGITKSSTTADRQAERTKLKSELQSWADSNGFLLSKIMPKLGTSQT